MNEPIELLQPNNGCVSCVIANIFYMFTGSMPSIRSIDRKIDRSSGQPADGFKGVYFLIESGFRAEVIEKWDPARFVQGGRQYLKEIAGSDWKSNPASKWSDARLQAEIAEAQIEAKREKNMGSRLKRVHRHPVFEDITRLAKQRKAVFVSINSGWSSVSHALLIYDFKNSSFLLYNPKSSGQTLEVWPKSKLQNLWRKKLLIAAFWK